LGFYKYVIFWPKGAEVRMGKTTPPADWAVEGAVTLPPPDRDSTFWIADFGNGTFWVPTSVRHIDPTPGQLLSFPIKVFLNDGTVVEWVGSPDSERPALTILVKGPSTVLADSAALAAGGVAFLVLLIAAVYLQGNRPRGRR
jgi:hypothetical protein